MFLKRITISGFKSFANKTVLDLEPGMTAVVGPNGSGKSNVADAIRWALGEQSKSRLRLGDREEVVFAGSDKRPRASLAEVTLLFDNEAGTFPLDLTEVEISRRLYRSGETEYRLGGRPVKLGDLQQLLAEAGFGTSSYAVIGQGMIDSLLLSSPAERKLLFDEAAGIRGAELKREASVRKLAATEANLVRLRDIAAELAPRAAAAERAAEVATEQARLAERVHKLRNTIIATATAELGAQATQLERALNSRVAAAEADQTLVAELKQRQAHQLSRAATAEAAAREQQELIGRLERRRDELILAQSEVGARLATAEAAGDLAPLKRRSTALAAAKTELENELSELAGELKSNDTATRRAQTAIDTAQAAVKAAGDELLAIRQQLSDGTQQQYVGHALALVKTIARHLDTPSASVEELRLLVHKTGRLLSHATRTGEAELVTDLKAAQARLESAMDKRETAAEHLSNLTLSRRSLELEQTHQTEAVKRLHTQLGEVEHQLRAAEASHAKLGELRAAAADHTRQLAELAAQLETVRGAAGEAVAAPAQAVADLAIELDRTQQRLAAAKDQIAAATAQRAEIADRQEHYHQLARSWNVAGDAHPDLQPVRELEATLTRLEGELDARTELSRSLKLEYDEVSARQSELATQIADLEAAATDLRTIVERLSDVVKTRFKDNFERLSGEFAGTFSRLFGGGTAGLELIEDESGQYGIAIKASPKGKRLATLAALSGGERALAGVALLAAILTVNPSPFVVLDEIDAALDDANAGRLADILGELATRSQLIVITHNRQTMKAARVLFGVTMNEHHVSHLLSLHLEQATEMAAR